MLKKSILICSLCVAFISLTAVYASQASLPSRGASMENVLSMIGEPDKKLESVGQPPITRWIYPNYTLYFEDSLLLHAVENPTEKSKNK